jgi:hypothetical protein
MFDSKFLYTIVGLVVAIFAVCQFNKMPEIREGWWGGNPSRSVKVSSQVQTKDGVYSLPGWNSSITGGMQASGKEGFTGQAPGNFPTVSYPSYQSALSPRIQPWEGYSSSIRYNPPAREHMAVPKDPLTFSCMASENYSPGESNEGFCGGGSCGTSVASCKKGGLPQETRVGAPMLAADYNSGNFNELRDSLYMDGEAIGDSTIPLGTMTTLGADGNVIEPVVYNNFIYANRNSRLRSQGDWIRGDLPIVPCKSEWFRPSVQPNIDLNQGAMNVMGGYDSGTAQAMSQLIFNDSGMTNTTVGGINLTDLSQTNMSNQFNVDQYGISAVNVSSFS